MKIFLGNIPWYKDNLYGVRAGSRWPHFQALQKDEKISGYIPFPFFLSYAAAVLEKENIEVLLIDGIAEGLSREGFMEKLVEFSPDLILFETSTPTINYDLDYIDSLKNSYQKDCQIALAGPHSEMHKKTFLEKYKNVDIVFVGEYEITLKDVCFALKNGSSLHDVKGIIYRDKNKTIYVNEKRALVANVDDLPNPARHFLPMHNYRDLVCNLPEPSLQMWASRGCPFGCIFCFWPQVMYHGSSYRPRDPKKVVDELEMVLAKYEYKSYYFDDDTFNIGKPRILDLCNEIKKRKINLPWAIMARADTMDIEMLNALKDAGLYAVKYGMESVVQEIVDNSGKNLNLEKAQYIVRETQKLGIKVHLTFSFGLPGETKETIDKTINKIIELNPDSVQFSIIAPFPGSKYFEILKKKDLISSYHWDDYNGSVKAVFRTENLSEKDLEDAMEEAKYIWNKRYHLNPILKDKFFCNVKEGLQKVMDSMVEVKKILVFRSSFVEHTQNVFTVLDRCCHDAQIDLLVQKDFEDDFQDTDMTMIRYPGKNFNTNEESLKLMQKLASKQYDLAIILYNNTQRNGYAAVEELAYECKSKNLIGIHVKGDVIAFDLNVGLIK